MQPMAPLTKQASFSIMGGPPGFGAAKLPGPPNRTRNGLARAQSTRGFGNRSHGTRGTHSPSQRGRSNRRMSRRFSTVMPGMPSSPQKEEFASQENDVHDLLLNQFISMGYQEIGDGSHVMQPFDRLRLFLDWCLVATTVVNTLFIPMQVGFGWPRYWGSTFYLAVILDAVCFVDAVSYMFTGYFQPASEDLFAEDEEEDAEESDSEEEYSSDLHSPKSPKSPTDRKDSTSSLGPSKRLVGERKSSSFSRRASLVSKSDPTLTKVVEDAGIPKLILDNQLVLFHYLEKHAFFDAVLMAGFLADLLQLRGNLAALLLCKFVVVKKAYAYTLPNLTAHSRIFKYLLSVADAQAALLYYILYLVVFCHWVGCLFLFFAWRETSTTSEDGDRELVMLEKSDPWEHYVLALYWALQTTLTVGYGDVSIQQETTTMMVYSCVIIITSLLVGTFFTASTTVWLSNLDASQRVFRRKLHILKEFMTVYRSSIPPDLRGKLYLYLDFNYRQNQSTNMMDELLDGMPKQVQTAVKLATTQDLIRKVKLFQNVSKSFISAIVMLLRPSVVLKGDTIFRCGDHGEEMYFLNRGHLSVLLPNPGTGDSPKKRKEKHGGREGRRHSPILWDDPDSENWKKVASLRSGAYFGEIALFTNNNTRTATIQAVVNSTYFTLSRDDFNRICPSFPDVGRILRSRAQSIIRENQGGAASSGAMDPSSSGSPLLTSKFSGLGSPHTPSVTAMTAQSREVSSMRVGLLRARARAASQAAANRKWSPRSRGELFVDTKSRSGRPGAPTTTASGSPKVVDSKALARLKRGSIIVAPEESVKVISALSNGLGRIGDDAMSASPRHETGEQGNAADDEGDTLMELSGQLGLVVACHELVKRWQEDKTGLLVEFESQGVDPDDVLVPARVVLDPNRDVLDKDGVVKESKAILRSLEAHYEERDDEALLSVIRKESQALLLKAAGYGASRSPSKKADRFPEFISVSTAFAAQRLAATLQCTGSGNESDD